VLTCNTVAAHQRAEPPLPVLAGSSSLDLKYDSSGREHFKLWGCALGYEGLQR